MRPHGILLLTRYRDDKIPPVGSAVNCFGQNLFLANLFAMSACQPVAAVGSLAFKRYIGQQSENIEGGEMDVHILSHLWHETGA